MKEVCWVINFWKVCGLEQRDLDEGGKEGAGMGVPGQGEGGLSAIWKREVAVCEVLQADMG